VQGVLFCVGARSNALLGAFIHRTVRGQAAGGLRHWPYPTVEAFVRDGLRLALAMTRKNALSGLWWGGGKGIICRGLDSDYQNDHYRETLYAEYGEFVSSLRGSYITAEDAGTTPSDIMKVFSKTRFTTCVAPHAGGSGNPSGPTARGVLSAMEAALEHLDQGTLKGKRIAMQGAGNVAKFMIEGLIERGVEQVIATDIDSDRVALLRKVFDGKQVKLHVSQIGDLQIFSEPCDIFVPNALGGVLNPDTIPLIQAKIVCGAANNQLLHDMRDITALEAQGITYVPDFLCNRMGIVHCANEQYGQVPGDPNIERHLGRTWENSIFLITKRVLAAAVQEATSTSTAANQLADTLSLDPHPLWGHRGKQIIAGLVKDNWHTQLKA